MVTEHDLLIYVLNFWRFVLYNGLSFGGMGVLDGVKGDRHILGRKVRNRGITRRKLLLIYILNSALSRLIGAILLLIF